MITKPTYQEDFCDALEGTGISAMHEASRYLFKGIGIYAPDPPLRGVANIEVLLHREFGIVFLDIHKALLKFEALWTRDPDQRRVYIRHFLARHKPVPEFDWFKERYREELKQEEFFQKTSADYMVSFCGTAGVWSAKFRVFCNSLSRGAVVEHADEYCIGMED